MYVIYIISVCSHFIQWSQVTAAKTVSDCAFRIYSKYLREWQKSCWIGSCHGTSSPHQVNCIPMDCACVLNEACHCFTFIKPVGNEETNPCEAIKWYTTPLRSREDLPPPVAPGASTLQSPCPGFSRWFPRINGKNSKNPLMLSKFAVSYC